MKFKAPLVTLGAGLVVAGVLYTLNVDLSNDVEKNNAAANQTTTAAAPASSQPAVDPPPSAAPASSAPVGDGSGNAAQQGTVTYAGAVDGGAASLAIVINNGKAIAYVCDGKKVEAWLNGTAANGQIELTGAKGSLKGTYGGGQVKGTVAAGVKSWGFTVKLAAKPSGLYRSAASLRDKLDASWVVLPDGRQVGVKTDKNGATSEAPPFDMNSKTVTVDGTKIPIESGDPNAGSGN
jgi:serine/threonine-protein kinase